MCLLFEEKTLSSPPPSLIHFNPIQIQIQACFLQQSCNLDLNFIDLWPVNSHTSQPLETQVCSGIKKSLLCHYVITLLEASRFPLYTVYRKDVFIPLVRAVTSILFRPEWSRWVRQRQCDGRTYNNVNLTFNKYTCSTFPISRWGILVKRKKFHVNKW